MRKTCPRTCVKLEACSASTETASADEGPHSTLCSEPFECPVANDERADCAERARRGECRAASRWRASPLTITCMLSCHLLDPSSVSHAVTRPPPLRSAWVDAAPLFSLRHRHGASACHVGSPPAALLGGRCPNLRRRRRHALHARFAPQRQHGAGCPAPGALLTPRLPHPDPTASSHRSSRGPPGPGGEGGGEGGGGEGGEGGEGGGEGGGGAGGGEGGGAAAARLAAMIPKTVGSRAPAQAWDASAMRVQTVYDSPRVRLVHNMVTAEEAAHLIAIGKPRYARSSTARAGSDD
jgi:prolyl 4-hydroxylase